MQRDYGKLFAIIWRIIMSSKRVDYYYPETMRSLLLEAPEFRRYLYCKGFLLTTKAFGNKLDEYPFYGHWNEQILKIQNNIYYLYTHCDTKAYIYQSEDCIFFLVGHAYDPFHSIVDENTLLRDMSDSFKVSESAYWERESDLTGVFITGFISIKGITYSTDCCGMQYVCYGVVDENLYIASHAKLVGDLCGLEQDDFIKHLVNSRTWHFYGRWLPGDLSPYTELKRLVPNIKGDYFAKDKSLLLTRYYPNRVIKEIRTEKDYQDRIAELGEIMSNSMRLIAEKWNDQDISISVTGGRDSMTTLACTNGMYEKFSYFSYISNEPESIDAYAAHEICKNLGLKHSIYIIPEWVEDRRRTDIFAKVLECNAGCIGKNNANDVRKRLYFIDNPKFDIEVKSWLNEMGRGWYYKKYKKDVFPKYPSASMLRTMHKPYLSPYTIHVTTKIFQKWIDTYFSGNVLDKISWVDLFYWEFTWAGNEGISLNSEHRVSYEIVIPFNNRKYFELMLTLPLKKRKEDRMPIDIIGKMNKAILDSGIVVKDVNLSDLRTVMVRTYFALFNRLKF